MTYLATPYTDANVMVMESRYWLAVELVAELVHLGKEVFSPIVHSHQISKLNQTGGYEFWRKFDERMIRDSDEFCIALMFGASKSEGIREELKYARSIGKPCSLLNVISFATTDCPNPWPAEGQLFPLGPALG